jgi:hypothetical protein
MVQLAYIVAGLAVAGAFASWIIGAICYAQTLQAMSDTQQPRGLWLRAIVAWPSMRKHLRGAAGDRAATVNKALVSFLACLMVAMAAISVATNLARVSR